MASGDAPHGEHDHSKTEPAIREILASLGLSAAGLRWIESYSHSAWMTDEVVVRAVTTGSSPREYQVSRCTRCGTGCRAKTGKPRATSLRWLFALSMELRLNTCSLHASSAGHR